LTLNKTNEMKNILFLFLMLSAIITNAQPPCYVPTGALSWSLPNDHDPATDRILIFAKKVGPADSVIYINIGEPTKDPTTYGAPDTNLNVLNGSIPLNIQYENDSLAMLIYNDTLGYCVEFSGGEDTTYIFAVFRTFNGIYSNPMYARGSTIAVQRVFTILMANSTRLQWRKEPSIAIDTVICVYSTDSITIKPTGYAAKYLPGLSKNYQNSTSFLNGTDESQGKILYNSIGDRTEVSKLPIGEVWINIFTNQDTCWSKPVTRLIDTR